MSNKIGDIYGTIKDGKSCIKIESDIVDISGLLLATVNTKTTLGNHNISKLTLVGNEIKKHEDPDTTNTHYKKGKWHNWYHNGNNTTYPSSGNNQYTYYTNNIQLYNGYDHNGIDRQFPPNNIIGTQSNSNQGSLDSGDEAFCLNTYYHLNTFTGWDISYANKAWCPWTGFDVDSSMNNDNDTFFKKDTYGIEVQKSGFYNIVYNTQWNYNTTNWNSDLGFDKIGLIAVLLKNPGRSNQEHILNDDINESISSLRRKSDIWINPAPYYSGDINVFNIYLEEGETIGVGYLGFLYDEYRTDAVNNFAYEHSNHRYSGTRQSLNTLGWYGWDRRQELKVHNIILNKLEVQAITSSTLEHITLPISKGMIVQVQHKDYKKSVTKNGNYWDDIDNNLETGFVVAIQPTNSASNVLVSCNIHIGINQSADARWWGARLYRKIGDGNWTHVSEADNNEPNGATGTSVWLSDNMGIHSTEANTKVSNLGNSFLDSPNTTEVVYYTLYWKSRLGESVGDDTIYLNRAASSGDMYRALPISSITAKEIWNLGTRYTPENNLITLDTSNIVVSGNIIPDISNTYDLGSVDKPFRDMYISTNTIYMGETLLTIDENDNTFKVKKFRSDWNTKSISSDVNNLLNNKSIIRNNTRSKRDFLKDIRRENIKITELEEDIFEDDNLRSSKLDLKHPSNNKMVTINPHSSISENFDLILPANAGTNGQFLQTNGSGLLTWANIVGPVREAVNYNILYYDPTSKEISYSNNNDISLGNVNINTLILADDLKINGNGQILGPGSLIIDPAPHNDNNGTLYIKGNLNVQGTTTTVNSTTVEIADKILILNKDQTGTPDASIESGIEVERGDSDNAKILWNEATDQWDFLVGSNLATLNANFNNVLPAGIIVMWNGASNAIPSGWYLCNGTNGTPNLSGRFVVGYDSGDVEYQNLQANTGGIKTNVLNSNHLPAHTHQATASQVGNHTHGIEMNSDYSNPEHEHGFTTNSAGNHNHSHAIYYTHHTNQNAYYPFTYEHNGSSQYGWRISCSDGDNKLLAWNQVKVATNWAGNHSHSGTTNQTQINHRHSIQGNTQQSGSHTHTIQIGNTGSNPTSGIENRPPYYVLCYIMKA